MQSGIWCWLEFYDRLKSSYIIERPSTQNGGVIRMSEMSSILDILLYRDDSSRHEPN